MGAFEAVYADSGSPVPGLTADNLGDVLIGVSRSVFERSAFLGQASLPVSQTPELEKRLSALVSSGEEDVSASQVGDTLAEWQRKRQYRSKGAIPTLEARRSELGLALEAVRDVTGQIRDSKTEIDKYEEVRAKLKHQIDLYHAKQDSAQAEAYTRAEGELKRASEQLERLQAQLPEGGLPDKQALERARDQVAQLRGLDNSLKQAAQAVPEAQVAWEEAQARAEDPVFAGEASAARSRAQEADRRIEDLARRAAAGRPVCLAVSGCGGGAGAGRIWLGVGCPGGLCPDPSAGGAGGAGCGLRFGGGLGRHQEEVRRRDTGGAGRIPGFRAGGHRPGGGGLLRPAGRGGAGPGGAGAGSGGPGRSAGPGGMRIGRNCAPLVDTFAPEVKDVFGFSAAVTRGLTLLDALDKARQNRGERPAAV